MYISFATFSKLFYIICALLLTLSAGDDLGKCADALCSVPIGQGVAMLHYNAIDREKVGLLPGDQVEIFVRDYGKKQELIGVKVNGKMGFVPKAFVKETSVKVSTLVPATVKFGYTQENLNPVTGHVASESFQQNTFNPMLQNDINTQASMQYYQANQGSPLGALESLGSSENLQLYSSQHDRFSATGGSIDPQFGSTYQQQASPSSAHIPQVSNPYPSNIQQQFSDLSNVQFPQGEFNSPLQTGSSVIDNFQQQPGSEIANIAQQQVVLALLNQNPSLSISQAEQLLSKYVEQTTHTHLNPHQQQFHQFDSSSPQHQQDLGSIQASFSSSYNVNPSDASFSAGSPIGEINIGNSLPTSEQIISEPTISHSNSYYGTPIESNQYQDTADLLRGQGYDYGDFSYGLSENQRYGYDYNQDYSSKSSVSHQYLQSSHGLLDQNNVNPSFESVSDKTSGTFQEDPSHKSVPDSLSYTASLDSSFHATSTQLKVDSYANTGIERTFHTEESLTPGVSESSVEIDKNNELDSDEGEADVESADSDVEIMYDNNKENSNVVESDHELKIDPNSKQDEVSNIEARSQSATQISSTHDSSRHESRTHTNTDEPSTQIQGTISNHTNVNSEVSGAESELNSVNDPNLINNEVYSNSVNNQNVDSVVSSEVDIQASVASTSQSVLASQYPTEVHVEKLKDEHDSVNEIEQVTQTPDEIESFLAVTENKSAASKESQIEVNSNLNSLEVDFNEDINKDFSFDGLKDISTSISVNGTDSILEEELEVEDQTMNISEISEAEENGYLSPYQIRNLKEDQKGSENVESTDELNENVTYPEEDEYSMIENSLEAIRSFIEALLPWIPEPLYSIIMDLEKKGISPRVAVFTALSALPCIILIVAVVLIKEKSKERKLTVQLAVKEKGIFVLTAEKVALEEKLKKTTAEFESSKNMLGDERKTFDSMKKEVESLKQQIEKAKLELENSADEIISLKERDKEFMELIKDHEKIHLDLMEEKSGVDKKVAEQEDDINRLSDQVDEKENEITLLQAEVEKYKQSNEDYDEKLNQLQTNCNQLLKEAEVWNMRVNELTSKLSEESSAKEELENALELKESEVKSLTHLVQTLKSFEDIDSGNEDEQKSNEEKLKCLMDSSKVLIELQKQEEENTILSTKLSEAKNKILEIEVEVLESKSEIDKLKVNYNQALQDKAEATTKLEVLTSYFKDKELMLQKQLGAQEAFREKREKDADSAERQIVLIEKENASYKYQVASMKQEMEETERNLKTQIATQEKKAHENWIAARAAERKLEDMKQEVTQLRQRLTLLEREQENWANSSRDEIIRPIPKRISGMNDDPSHAPDLNNSMDPRHMFPLPPPMMLPPDRPLPPLPPLPPFLPPLEPPPFRPQPWHLPSDPGSDFRMTPPDFMRRELTPPRGRHSAIIDGDIGPLQSSPLGGDMRESRNSTPPHNLPSFHDIPPPPPRMFFPPPPGHHPRYPQPPVFRREFAPGHKRIDNQSDNSSTGLGTQPISSSQEQHPHNSRV